MLDTLSKHFELIIYTSSDSEYAKSALNTIEAETSYFSYRLTKENCIRIPEVNYHAKDLRQLLSNRDLS
jgi:CTD small phosphatase-like protein 2